MSAKQDPDNGSMDVLDFHLPVDSTMAALLNSEDTDNDKLITVDDRGPKVGVIRH